MFLRFIIFLKLKLQNKTIYSTVNYMVHYTLILEGKYRLSIGRLSFPHLQGSENGRVVTIGELVALDCLLDVNEEEPVCVWRESKTVWCRSD